MACDAKGSRFPHEEWWKGPFEAGGQGPYLAVRFVVTSIGPQGGESAFESGEQKVRLAIRTRAGWFVTRPIAELSNPGVAGVFQRLEVTELTIRDLIPGESPEVLARVVREAHDSDMGVNEYEDSDEELLIVCGLGKAGHPRCIAPLRTGASQVRAPLCDPTDPACDDPNPRKCRSVHRRWCLDASFSDAGVLKVLRGTCEAGGRLPPEARTSLGTHEIRF